MKSKVTGAEHRIKQAVDVVTVGHPDYNEAAKEAMTSAHGDVACYASRWLERQLPGLPLLPERGADPARPPVGRADEGPGHDAGEGLHDLEELHAGLDERGRVAVPDRLLDHGHGRRGGRHAVLDQELPVTANGLSGMTMIHHQLHSTRPTARSCVECHRASETWGMGSGNFRLGRQLAFAADRRGGGPRLRPREPAPLRAARSSSCPTSSTSRCAPTRSRGTPTFSS